LTYRPVKRPISARTNVTIKAPTLQLAEFAASNVWTLTFS
jgi:hypothetical protein